MYKLQYKYSAGSPWTDSIQHRNIDEIRRHARHIREKSMLKVVPENEFRTRILEIIEKVVE